MIKVLCNFQGFHKLFPFLDDFQLIRTCRAERRKMFEVKSPHTLSLRNKYSTFYDFLISLAAFMNFPPSARARSFMKCFCFTKPTLLVWCFSSPFRGCEPFGIFSSVQCSQICSGETSYASQQVVKPSRFGLFVGCETFWKTLPKFTNQWIYASGGRFTIWIN